MTLKRDIKKAIEANTKYRVNKVFKPTLEYNGYDLFERTNVMCIEIIVTKKAKKWQKQSIHTS